MCADGRSAKHCLRFHGRPFRARGHAPAPVGRRRRRGLTEGCRQRDAKCRFTVNFNRRPDQFCRLLDRLSGHLAFHWLPPLQNVVVVDAFGALLAEVGPQEEAVEVLKRAVELAPDSGFEKYMCGASALAPCGKHALRGPGLPL